MRTADDDSGPVPYETFRLPRAVLNWETPPRRGAAGRGQRDELDPDGGLDPDRTPVSRRAPLAGSRVEPRASTDELDDAPTTALPVLILPRTPERPDALQAWLARAARLWNDRPLRTAAILAGVVLISYLAVDGARHRSSGRSQTVLAPAAALPSAGPIIVEQLDGARGPRENGAAPLPGEQSDGPGRRRVGRRARETSFAAMPASKSSGDQAIAPAQSKPRQAAPSSATVSSSSAGLPAWGAEAVRDFSSGKSSKAATAATASQALMVKSASSSADIPSSTAVDQLSAREQPKPAPLVAAKPAGPPEPVAPPPPSKPLTMDQMLNRVEEAAQAQRKQAGLKAPKTSERDLELDALINGAMK